MDVRCKFWQVDKVGGCRATQQSVQRFSQETDIN